MKIDRHVFRSYIAMINGSVGSNMFRHFYASFDGIERDTMNGGQTSCAYFVSCVLTIFGMIKTPSFVVGSLVDQMEKAGWQKVDQPECGDVLVYEDQKSAPEDALTPHVGFYIGNDKAVSTSSKIKTPIEHDWLCRGTKERAVIAIYRGKHLIPDTVKIIEP